MNMFSRDHQTLKIELPSALWERLKYYARQRNVSEAEAVAKLLEQQLPNLTSGLALVLEKFTDKEKEILKRSYYVVTFLVSYADQHASLMEGLAIENEFQKLAQHLGGKFADLVGLSKEEQHDLLEEIKQFTPEDQIIHLLDIRKVLDKLPERLAEEYKATMLDSGIAVAQASREGLFSGDRVSQEEKNMLFVILFLLNINIEAHAAFFGEYLVDIQRLETWKRKQRQMIS